MFCQKLGVQSHTLHMRFHCSCLLACTVLVTDTIELEAARKMGTTKF